MAWSDDVDRIGRLEPGARELAELGWLEIDLDHVLKMGAAVVGLDPISFNVEVLAGPLQERASSAANGAPRRPIRSRPPWQPSERS